MSIFSYLNANSNSSSSISTLYASTLQKLEAAKASEKQAASSEASGTGVTISADAVIAAAIKADAGKSAQTLTGDVRKALDGQYEEAGAKATDLSGVSPRALATIILNKSGDFTAREVLAAKAEMRARDRAAFMDAMQDGLSIAALQSYQAQQLVGRADMSDEERSVRNHM